MADSPAAVSRASFLPVQVSGEICVSLVTARSGLCSPTPAFLEKGLARLLLRG